MGIPATRKNMLAIECTRMLDHVWTLISIRRRPLPTSLIPLNGLLMDKLMSHFLVPNCMQNPGQWPGLSGELKRDWGQCGRPVGSILSQSRNH